MANNKIDRINKENRKDPRENHRVSEQVKRTGSAENRSGKP